MSYKKVEGEEGDTSLSTAPKEEEPMTQAASKGNWKKELLPSRPDLIVYQYDVNMNRYKPYKAQEIKLSEEFPQKEINKVSIGSY